VTLELDVVTLFPGYFDWLRETRPVRNAVQAGSLALRTIDLREFGLGDYRQADDAPYGGGAGMVIRVDVVCAALEATYGVDVEAILAARRVAVLTPVGRQLTDAIVTELAGLGYTPHPSGSNFVLFGGVDDPHAVFEALAERGILIRDVGIPHHLRVTAGTEEETTAFLDALAALGRPTAAPSVDEAPERDVNAPVDSDA